MEQAENFFSCYYYDGAGQNLESETQIWDMFIQECSKEHVKTASDQLIDLIKSDMRDNELRNFIHTKLGSAHFAKHGHSRSWLIEICDYIQENT